MKKVTESYLKKENILELYELISKMPTCKRNALLLDIYNDKSKDITPATLLKNYKNNYEYFGISDFSLREKNWYNGLFLSVLPQHYKDINLSLLNPMGTNSSITPLSQNLVMSTVKHSEVISDPTTALTLEGAKLRKELVNNGQKGQNVDLGTIAQILRMQPFDKSKGYMQHFDLFGISSLGRNGKDLDFEVVKLIEHIEIWLNFIRILQKNNFNLNNISVSISFVPFIEHLIACNLIKKESITINSLNDDYDMFAENNISLPNKINSTNEIDELLVKKYDLEKLKETFKFMELCILKDLKQKYQEVQFNIELNRKAGLGYYKNYCFHIYENTGNSIVQLSDGGVTNWGELLLSSKKERNVTSGFGAELVLKLFKERGKL